MLTPNFSVTQSTGRPSALTFVDTSTGSDGAITSRRIYIQKVDGTYLVTDGTTTDYMVWSYLVQTILLAGILQRDYGVYVTVGWYDVSGTELYTKSYAMSFTAYGINLTNRLTQAETDVTKIVGNTTYWRNKAKLITDIDSARQAIAEGSDYRKAQVFLDITYNLATFKNKYF